MIECGGNLMYVSEIDRRAQHSQRVDKCNDFIIISDKQNNVFSLNEYQMKVKVEHSNHYNSILYSFTTRIEYKIFCNLSSVS